jgi:ribbon-helix-helix protein, copG family
VRDFSLRAKTLQSSFFQSKEIKKMIKNENIKFRISADLKALLKEKASRVGISESEFIRKSILNSEIINQITKQIDPQIRYSFFQASNNLNQIAKATNTIAKQEQISTDSQIKILEALFKNEQLLTKIYALLKGKE